MRKLLIILIFASCNPVKQVLKDKQKLDEVAKEVIRQGYCANDTTVIVKSDTTLLTDTLIENHLDTIRLKDTSYVVSWKNRTITNTVIVHDTLRSYILDNSRIDILTEDLNASARELDKSKTLAQKRLLLLSIVSLILLFLILHKIIK